MRSIERRQFTLGQLMIAIGLAAVQATLIRATTHTSGLDQLLAFIGAVWFLPVSLLVFLKLRASRESGQGWIARHLYARHCPRCERKALVIETPPDLFECGACGARFLWRKPETWEFVSSQENQGEWMSPYLKHVRAMRRRMRPTDVPALELTPKSLPVIFSEPRLKSVSPRAPAHAKRSGLFTVLVLAFSAVSLLGFVFVAYRWAREDEVALLVVLTIVFYSVYFCLLIAVMSSFRWSQVLLMLAVSAGLQTLFLAVAGRHLSWAVILGSVITIPTIPLLLGTLIARFEWPDSGPVKTTLSRLLQSRRRRALSLPVADGPDAG